MGVAIKRVKKTFILIAIITFCILVFTIGCMHKYMLNLITNYYSISSEEEYLKSKQTYKLFSSQRAKLSFSDNCFPFAESQTVKCEVIYSSYFPKDNIVICSVIYTFERGRCVKVIDKWKVGVLTIRDKQCIYRYDYC